MEVFIAFAVVILFIGFAIKTVSKGNSKSDINDNINITTTSNFYERERSGRN
ncbi:hypothetical protein [Aliarcobacter butzleri]|uniref:hypothetical protein n=1 Tax=Aliarcobacter butzleri TaxID=28197 RepID=UPI00189DA873|nr:hypothetical protein [Aliarcobacter butzleri]